jgi:hypothetical protein
LTWQILAFREKILASGVSFVVTRLRFRKKKRKNLRHCHTRTLHTHAPLTPFTTRQTTSMGQAATKLGHGGASPPAHEAFRFSDKDIRAKSNIK